LSKKQKHGIGGNLTIIHYFLAGSMSEQIKLNQIIVKPNSMNPFGKNHFASSSHRQQLSGC